jgi:hypothetical protein
LKGSAPLGFRVIGPGETRVDGRQEQVWFEDSGVGVDGSLERRYGLIEVMRLIKAETEEVIELCGAGGETES